MITESDREAAFDYLSKNDRDGPALAQAFSNHRLAQIERDAVIAERNVPQHERNEVIGQAIARNIAKAIREQS